MLTGHHDTTQLPVLVLGGVPVIRPVWSVRVEAIEEADWAARPV
jgi:hypothetical protein